MRCSDLPCCRDAASARHRTIHQDDAGLQIPNHLNRTSRAVCLSHNTNAIVVFEKASKTPPDQGVIIDQQYCDLIEHAPYAKLGSTNTFLSGAQASSLGNVVLEKALEGHPY